MFCWNLWWVNQWLAGKTPLLQSNMIHHPFGMALNRHTLSVANGIIAAPLTHFYGPVQAYNLLIILHALLTSFGMYFLAREFKAGKKLSVLASMLFTWWPARLVHAGIHLNLASTGWMLFALICLIRCCKQKQIRWIAASAFFIALTGGSSWHLLQQLGMALPFILLAITKNSFTRCLFHVFVAFATGVILLLPLIVPLIQTDPDIPPVAIEESRRYSIQPASLFIPSAGNPIFHNAVQNHYSRLPGNVIENTGFIGFTVLLLIIAGVVYSPVRNKILIGAGLLFVLLSLGPDLQLFSWRIPLPFTFLARIPIPGFSRTPGRFMIAAGLLLSVSCALTLEHKRFSAKKILWVLFVLPLVEFLPGSLQIVKIGSLSECDYIASRESSGVLIVPNDWSNQYHMLAQTHHQQPIATGFAARLPMTVFQRIDGIPGLQGLSNPETAWLTIQALTPLDWVRIRNLLNIDTVVFYSRFCSPPPTDTIKHLAHLNPVPVFPDITTDHPDLIIDLTRFDIYLPEPELFPLDRWSGPENWGIGMNTVYWGLYPSARLRLLHTGNPIQISFKSLASRQSDDVPVTTRIRLDDTDLYTFTSVPQDGWVPVTFNLDPEDISASFGSSGSTPYIDLWFDFSSGTAPSQLENTTGVASDDMRLLSLAIRELTVDLWLEIINQ